MATWEMNLDYLSGRSFNNGLSVRIDHIDKPLISRDEELINYAQEKKVAHIGCLDHEPLLHDKIAKGTWLHNKLIEASTECHGFDIDTELIAKVEQKYGIKNLHILHDDAVYPDLFDVVLVPDVIEHVAYPPGLIADVIEHIKSDVYVITTPNALRVANLAYAQLLDAELINSDHRWWFTPYTLMKAIYYSGVTPKDVIIRTCTYAPKEQCEYYDFMNMYRMTGDIIIAEIHM